MTHFLSQIFTTIPRARRHPHVFGRLMRMACVFLLVFSTTFNIQGALATEPHWYFSNQPQDQQTQDQQAIQEQCGNPGQGFSQAKSAETMRTLQEARSCGMTVCGKTPQDSSDGTTTPRVFAIDLAIFLTETTQNAFAYASNGQVGTAEITARGGSIDFDGAVWLVDSETGTIETVYNSQDVTWTVSDSSIAHISPQGLLTAQDDGVVRVSATIDGSMTEYGDPLVAQVDVTIAGQHDTPYVTSVTVCDDADQPIDPSFVIEGVQLSVAVVDLHARVVVHDPTTGADTEYIVKPGSGLSSQTGGVIPDLEWSVSDPQLGSVSIDGQYRPYVEASCVVTARSTAGFNNQAVIGEANIIMPSPEGQDGHPQGSLHIIVTWENYPDQVVAEKTYTAEQLASEFENVKATYTAQGGTTGEYGFKTYTGEGPKLADVVTSVGCDLEGIKLLRFGTYDNVPTEVSWDFAVNTDRYYFPNLDIGSYAGPEQVFPIIAIRSATAPDGDSSPVPDNRLSNAAQFRLLFGSTGTGQRESQFQIYWIHTLYVVLEGGPPAEGGTDNSDGGGVDGEGDGVGSGEGSGEGTGSGSGKGAGSGSGGIDDEGSGVGTAGPVSVIAQGGAGGEGGPNSGAWSVLQQVSNNKSDVAPLLDGNPFAPYALPFGTATVATGGVEKFVRYRWQKRTPNLPNQEP